MPGGQTLFPNIGEHLAIFLGGGTVGFHNFSGKSDSVFRRYAVPPAIPRGTTGGTLSDTNLVKGFVKPGIAPLMQEGSL